MKNTGAIIGRAPAILGEMSFPKIKRSKKFIGQIQ